MIIEMEDLTKIYRTEEVKTTALDNINLRLEDEQFVSIMGPPGCGKSTLLHVLGLIDDFSNGNYRLSVKTSQSIRKEEDRPCVRRI
jgi:putative ABC transport system ATP-binding protein